MTREEILAMPAGRELDALVAEKVMGWILEGNRCWLKPNGWPIDKTPNYSTDISAAFEVLDKFPHWKIILNKNRRDNRVYIETDDGSGYFAKDFPIPEAICRAVLETVSEESL